MLFVIFVCGNEDAMTPWWITLLAAVIPAIITCFVTLYCTKKSYINQNTDEKRINRFTLEQQEIARTVNDIQLLAESWKRLAAECPELREKIKKLELENKELRHENELLKEQHTVRKVRR